MFPTFRVRFRFQLFSSKSTRLEYHLLSFWLTNPEVDSVYDVHYPMAWERFLDRGGAENISFVLPPVVILLKRASGAYSPAVGGKREQHHLAIFRIYIPKYSIYACFSWNSSQKPSKLIVQYCTTLNLNVAFSNYFV